MRGVNFISLYFISVGFGWKQKMKKSNQINHFLFVTSFQINRNLSSLERITKSQLPSELRFFLPLIYFLSFPNLLVESITKGEKTIYSYYLPLKWDGSKMGKI